VLIFFSSCLFFYCVSSSSSTPSNSYFSLLRSQPHFSFFLIRMLPDSLSLPQSTALHLSFLISSSSFHFSPPPHPLSSFQSPNSRASFCFFFFYLSFSPSISCSLSFFYVYFFSTFWFASLLRSPFLLHNWFSFLFLFWHLYIHTIAYGILNPACFRVKRNYVLTQTAVHFGPERDHRGHSSGWERIRSFL
jgi:hypothetical protein